MLVLSRILCADPRLALVLLGESGDTLELLYIIEKRAKFLLTISGKEKDFWILQKESLSIGTDIQLYLDEIHCQNRVRIGLTAPRELRIMRAELVDAKPDPSQR